MRMSIKDRGMLIVLLAIPLIGLAGPIRSETPSGGVATKRSPFIVFFDWNKFVVTSDGAETIDKAIAALGKSNDGVVRLIGHADRSGGRAANARLAQRRVDAVRALLAEKGVPESAIASQAVGESRPLVQVADGVREAQNRSVEIRVEPVAGE